MVFIKCPVTYSIQDLDVDLYGIVDKINNFDVNGVDNYLLVSLY